VGFAIPVFVGLSRVYRGMHFVSDVIAGAIAGGLWLAVVLVVLLPLHPHRRRKSSTVPGANRDGLS
jgi:undecaprenyl-diphosphatase